MKRVIGLILAIPEGVVWGIKMNIKYIKWEKRLYKKIIGTIVFILNMLLYPLLVFGAIMVAIFQPKLYDRSIEEFKETFDKLDRVS